MTTPFDNLIEWFGQLPSKYRQDLASEIAMLMPGIDVNPYPVSYTHLAFIKAAIANRQARETKGNNA